jgi:hypothetical protein
MKGESMKTTIIKALVISASLAAALVSGCAEFGDRPAVAGASTANDGATAPRIHSPYPDEPPFGN